MKETCLICSSPVRSIKDKKGKIYHICENCGFTSLDPMFCLSPSEEKGRYELHNNNPDDPGYRKWLSTFADQAVIPYAEPQSRILDFGSGPEPLLASILEDRGYQVAIYDKYFSDHPVEGLFHMITMTEVLEHIANPCDVLKRLKVKLEPRGYLSIKTSFRPAGDGDFLGWWYRQDSTHISFFTERSLRILADSLSLHVELCDGKSLLVLRN